MSLRPSPLSGTVLPSVLAVLAVLAWPVVFLAGCGSQTDLPRPEVLVEPVTGMELVRVSAGTYRVGSPPDEPGREPQERLHRVVLSRSFDLGRYEVTQRQWRLLMGDDPSRFQGCDDCPVENVSWFRVREFLVRLSQRTGDRFRLPTEAEWEVACRAGASTPFATGDRLGTDQANYDGRYRLPAAPGEPPVYRPGGLFRGRTTRVGSFRANRWGLFDLHGNVWEWVADEHCPYPGGPDAIVDPLGACAPQISAGKKVIRGGSWLFGEDSARCALRYTHRPSDVGPSLGFRALREVS